MVTNCSYRWRKGGGKLFEFWDSEVSREGIAKLTKGSSSPMGFDFVWFHPVPGRPWWPLLYKGSWKVLRVFKGLQAMENSTLGTKDCVQGIIKYMHTSYLYLFLIHITKCINRIWTVDVVVGCSRACAMCCSPAQQPDGTTSLRTSQRSGTDSHLVAGKEEAVQSARGGNE